MNRYSPLWSQVVDSSLWCEPDYVVKVFLTMIAKKDMDDVVRGSAFNIAQWAKKTEAEVLDALKILASPDTKRIEPQPFEGRRIEKVEDGWLVLNGAKYREMMSLATRREYKRIKQAEYRAKAKGGGVTIRETVRQSVESDPLTKADARELRRIKREARSKAGNGAQAQADAATDDRGVG